MRVLGIDPGSTRAGYGVVDSRANTLTHVASGVLSVSGATQAERLVSLRRSLEELVAETHPERVGIERLFFSKNRKTAIEVAQARGVILEALAAHRIPVFELTPGQVKAAVTGDGAAAKDAVARMVHRILSLPSARLLDDTTDALAMAIAVSAPMRIPTNLS
jgi:crossover junction endodeoxyribonuclease RuvC